MVRKIAMVGFAVVAALMLMSMIVSSAAAQTPPAPPKATATATASAPAAPKAVAPAKTGNAGLFGTTGTSLALVLTLGVFAATMIAGARTATRSR